MSGQKARYSKEAWERRLAYGRAYRKRLKETVKGKKRLAKYRRKWYVENRESILRKEFERRQQVGAHVRGPYKNTKWKRRMKRNTKSA